MRSISPMVLPIAGVLLASLHCSCVGAEIRVQGQAGDVRLEAHDATVAEILAALGERYAVHYRGTTGSGGVTATFEGPLRRVVARVLNGHNYVIQARGDALEVIVVSVGSSAAAEPPMRTISPMVLPVGGVVLATGPYSCIGADIRLQGQAGDVRLEVCGATVAEILAALGERFAVRYRGTPGSGGVTATFEGPLRRVVARVLDGYNYVIQAHDGELDVIVVSTGSSAAPPQASAIPVAVNRRRER